jgi:hypothetical protein
MLRALEASMLDLAALTASPVLFDAAASVCFERPLVLPPWRSVAPRSDV